MNKMLGKLDSAIESQWLGRLKEGRDLVALGIGVVTSLFFLLREPDVQIRQSVSRLAPPRNFSRNYLQSDQARTGLGADASALLQASAILTLRVWNQTSSPVEMKYVRIVGLSDVLDYSVEWGPWSELVPDREDEVHVQCCGDGSVALPFLSTLPPRSTATVHLWIRGDSLKFTLPRTLAKADGASVVVFEDAPASAFATFIDSKRRLIAVLVVLLILWSMANRLAAKSPQER